MSLMYSAFNKCTLVSLDSLQNAYISRFSLTKLFVKVESTL